MDPEGLEYSEDETLSWTYEVVEKRYSNYDPPVFHVRCIETGEVVYETESDWAAELMRDRYTREGPP
jgi:hypothetical protein